MVSPTYHPMFWCPEGRHYISRAWNTSTYRGTLQFSCPDCQASYDFSEADFAVLTSKLEGENNGQKSL